MAGSDGNLWFTEYLANQVAKITPAGIVTDVQKVRGGPWGIGVGASNTIWVTQFDGNKITRIKIGP